MRLKNMNRTVLVSGLLVGAAGIALLWAAGVDFPVAIPPGLVILLVGAAGVALVRRRWADGVGGFLGCFVLIGFLLAGINGDGFDSLRGEHGVLGVVGQLVQLAGVGVAALVGVSLALRPSADAAR
jgi:hypothetical protein